MAGLLAMLGGKGDLPEGDDTPDTEPAPPSEPDAAMMAAEDVMAAFKAKDPNMLHKALKAHYAACEEDMEMDD